MQARPEGAVTAVLVAAGRGERLARERPKALVALAGRPLFCHALATLIETPGMGAVAVVSPRDPEAARALEGEVAARFTHEAAARIRVVPGGEERQDSVLEGLEALHAGGWPPETIVLVHDAARPLLSPALVRRCVEGMAEPLDGGGQSHLPGLEQGAGPSGLPAGVVPGLPVRETLKLVFEERIVLTQPRENLWSAQTPQVFRLGPLLAAHRRARRYGMRATDDAALLEWQGMAVRLISGEPANLKITYPEDLILAERLLGVRPAEETRGTAR